MQRLKLIIDVIAAIALSVAACAVAWNILAKGGKPAEVSLDGKEIAVAGSPAEGRRDAKAALVVFSDFECPFCRAFAGDVLPELRRRFVGAGVLQIAFKHFPLPSHQFARKAAIGAQCANRLGKFWPFHDRMFQDQSPLTATSIAGIADGLSLGDPWAQCADAKIPVVATEVDADIAEAQALGIRSTPTIAVGTVIGDRVTVKATVIGARPLSDFLAALQSVGIR